MQILLLLFLGTYIIFSICLFFIGRRLNSYLAWTAFIPYGNIYLFFHLGGIGPIKSCLLLGTPFLFGDLYWLGQVLSLFPGRFILVLLGFWWANIGVGRAMNKGAFTGVLGMIPVINIFWFLYLAFGEYERVNSRGQKIIDESEVYGMVEKGVKQGLSQEQILEYAKEANVSTLQVKRALFEIQKQQNISGGRPI